MVKAAREQLHAQRVSSVAVDGSTPKPDVARNRVTANKTGPKLAHALKRLRGAGDRPERLSKKSKQVEASFRRTKATEVNFFSSSTRPYSPPLSIQSVGVL